MPFYEYECSNCKHYTEVLQKISDAPLRKCPSCGRNTLKKLVSAPVFRLKGSGWYETDFKSDKETKRNLATADAEPSKDESSSESKSTESNATESKSSVSTGASRSSTTVRTPRKSATTARKSSTRTARPRSKPRTARKARS